MVVLRRWGWAEKPLAVLVLAGLAAAQSGHPADPSETVYVIETVAGSDLVGDGGIAIEAQISDARGVAVDRRGNLYIADTSSHRIRKVTPDGLISTVAGTGQPGYRGDGGPAVAAQLNRPYGLAVDAADNLYIADTYNHRVRKIDANGFITTVAGSGQKGSAETGEAPTTQLMAPRNLAFDRLGNLYIAEFEGHRVRKVTPEGKIATVAGTGVAGFKGDEGAATAAQLDHPAGVAVDGAGTLYIADSGNRRLRRVMGGAITTLLNMEWSDGVTAVAVSPAGGVVVSDRPYLIRALAPGGDWQTIAGTGQPAYNGDGKPALVTNLAPTDLAFDAAGNLYVAEKRRIRKITAGVVRTAAGDGTFGFRGDGGPATLAHLSGPKGLAVDQAGNLYVADSLNQRIRRIDPDGVITTVAGNGLAGSAGLNGPAIQASLSGPEGLAFDESGNLLIADRQNCRVLKLSAAGMLYLAAGRCKAGLGGDGDPAGSIPLFDPRAVASGRGGVIYISDTEHHRVLKATPDGIIVTYAGNGSKGYAGDGGRANAAQLDSPAGIALDAAGNLYIADTNNNRIRRVSAEGMIDTVAGAGWQGYGGDGGPATQAGLNQPSGVAVDSDGTLYIADTVNQRIRRVTPGGVIDTIAGNGLQGYEGDGGLATAAQLFQPVYIVLDGHGNLYFSDEFNDRVRKLSPHSLLSDALGSFAVLNAASGIPGPVAPGEIVSIYGGAIGPKTGAGARLEPNGLLATSLGESQVLFDGRPAPLFWVQDGQINAQVPYGVAGQAQTEVEVVYKGYSRGRVTVPVAEAAPGLFAIPGDPARGVIINQDWSVNSALYPAERNSIVTLFATGEGQTDPPGVEGKPATEPYPRPRLDVSLTIGGFAAEILYAGAAPGFAGLMQINARVPGAFLPSGIQPVVLKVGQASSQPGVGIVIR